LGGSLAAIRPKPASNLYHLVVCGATKPERDGFIFANFMAFCYYLSQKGAGGTFLNCLDIDKVFGALSNLTPSADTINFGYAGVIAPNTKPLLTYSRFQHSHRQQWWRDVRPHDLKKEVMTWIQETAQKAKPGDSVNIILESHGTEFRGVQLDSYWLSALEFCAGSGRFC